MRTILAVVAILASLPALAETAFAFRGQWDITIPGHPDYTGIALIDAERRTTLDDGYDRGFRGYVAYIDRARVEIVSTDRTIVS